MNKVKTLGNTLLVFGLVNSGISHLDAALLPVETFFKTPRYLQASLSPNGQHVGFIGFLNDSYDLFTLNLNTKKIYGTRAGMGLHVRRYYWADNENLVFNVTKWGQYSYGLYSVHREGKPLRTLIEIESFASILDLQDDVPNEILIQIGRNVYRQNYLKDIRQKGPMSPSSVTYRLKEENRGRVDAWMCDPEGFLRLGVGYKDRLFDEGNEKYIYRENEDLPWQKFPIAPDLDPVSFEYGSNYLYVATSRNRNTLALYNYDLENQYLGELIFSDRDYDVISGKFFYYHIPVIGPRFSYQLLSERVTGC